MTDIETIPNPPRPIVGGLPWHPETYFDLESLDLSQLPITETYPSFPGYRHSFTVRLVDYPENREAIKGVLIRHFLQNPASSFLREIESGLFAVLVFEKESTNVD